MAERWFSDEELTEMSRPTMDRAIEAGDLERAKGLCVEMKHERRFLHDLMVDGIAAQLGQGALLGGGGRRIPALGDGAERDLGYPNPCAR